MAPPGRANVFLVVTCYKCKKTVTSQMDSNHDENMPQLVDRHIRELLDWDAGEKTCSWHCENCKNDPEA